jgi:hypothetical protein
VYADHLGVGDDDSDKADIGSDRIEGSDDVPYYVSDTDLAIRV